MKPAFSEIKYLLVLACITISGCDFFFCRHPSDAKMIKKFYEHRADFEALQRMVLEDKHIDRIALTWTRPENIQEMGITAERVEEYRKILRRLDLPLGVEGFETRPDLVYVLATGCGLSVSGSSKSYVWQKPPPDATGDFPKVLTREIDSYVDEQLKLRREGKTDGRHIFVVRHIEGDWYLSYDD